MADKSKTAKYRDGFYWVRLSKIGDPRPKVKRRWMVMEHYLEMFWFGGRTFMPPELIISKYIGKTP